MRPARLWPVTLTTPGLTLRPLTRADETAWYRLREVNAAWLAPWEASDPPGHAARAPAFGPYVRGLDREAKAGRLLPWMMEADGRLIGRVTVSNITLGSLRAASVGYWIARTQAGRGLTPRAVALACDYCFTVRGLHRIEIAIRPENAASLRVVAKLGFRDEGMRPKFLHIAGQWADHRVFALNSDEVGPGLLARLDSGE